MDPSANIHVYAYEWMCMCLGILMLMIQHRLFFMSYSTFSVNRTIENNNKNKRRDNKNANQTKTKHFSSFRFFHSFVSFLFYFSTYVFWRPLANSIICNIENIQFVMYDNNIINAYTVVVIFNSKIGNKKFISSCTISIDNGCFILCVNLRTISYY